MTFWRNEVVPLHDLSLRGVGLVASALVLVGCSGLGVDTVADSPSGDIEFTEATEVLVPLEPDWVLTDPPSPVDECKIPDGQSPELQAVERGAIVNGVRARGNVGFPFIPDRFPIEGTARIVFGQVSFLDAPPTDQTPLEFFTPQAEKMKEWAQFWSQGKFSFDVQIIPDWIQINANSSNMPSDARSRAKIVQERIPENIDLEGVDGTFIYWAPGTGKGLDRTFALRVGSNENTYAGGPRPALFWAVDQYHIEETGNGIPYELKRDYTWAYLIHEIQHEQGLNTHSPGNGWATGVGQNQYPNPSGNQWSAALASWELWLLGWLHDEQVHCISVADLAADQQVILTPQEIYGGDRKIIVVPVSESDVVVVESRRPIGWTQGWDSTDQGLFVYTVNPQVEVIEDHEQGDCGNQREHSKWAYYLYPEGFIPAPCQRDYRGAIVREGMSVTHEGIRITLEHSADELDYVTVQSVAR